MSELGRPPTIDFGLHIYDVADVSLVVLVLSIKR
jgi:hypothetical protein